MSSASTDWNGSNRPRQQVCFYMLINARSGRATALVTNIDFSEAWDDYLGDPPLAMAFLDRIVDGAIIMKLKKGQVVSHPPRPAASAAQASRRSEAQSEQHQRSNRRLRLVPFSPLADLTSSNSLRPLPRQPRRSLSPTEENSSLSSGARIVIQSVDYPTRRTSKFHPLSHT